MSLKFEDLKSWKEVQLKGRKEGFEADMEQFFMDVENYKRRFKEGRTYVTDFQNMIGDLARLQEEFVLMKSLQELKEEMDQVEEE